MTLLKHVDRRSRTITWTGDDSEDLLAWLMALPDCPPVTQPVLLRCSGSSHHGEDPIFCGYVQADPRTGVARRRCVACAHVTDLLDSGDHWTYPDMFECVACRQSLVELAVGISAEAGEDASVARWLALAARCVGCGRITGLTDRTLAGRPLDEVLASV